MRVSANIATPKSCLLYLEINNSVTSFHIHKIFSNCRRPIIYALCILASSIPHGMLNSSIKINKQKSTTTHSLA